MIFTIAALVFVGIIAITLGPLITIWALNTLGLNIPYTFWNWLAVLWLMSVATASSSKK